MKDKRTYTKEELQARKDLVIKGLKDNNVGLEELVDMYVEEAEHEDGEVYWRNHEYTTLLYDFRIWVVTMVRIANGQ